MSTAWYRELYRLGSEADAVGVTVRMALAVGVPMLGGVLAGHPAAAVAGGATALFVTLSDIGQDVRVRLGTMAAAWVAIAAGGALGHLLGHTPYGREGVVLLAALLAGWASSSHPSIAVVTRFFAIAAAAATGMRFADPDVLLSVAVGGVSAFAAAYLVWRVRRDPPRHSPMDWRAGVRRAFAGVDGGVRFAVCYAGAAAVALFAASWLRVADSFWATLVVLMVMRREGIVSLELTIQYALGTIIGVLLGPMLLQLAGGTALAAAVLATLAAALARIGFSLNPALGYMAFTLFLMCAAHVVGGSGAMLAHLPETRLYDVTVGCLLALAGTLAARYPRGVRGARGADPSTWRNL